MKNKEFLDNSYLYSANAAFIEELYKQYLQDPQSLSEQWVSFFNQLDEDKADALKAIDGASWLPKTSKIIGVGNEADNAIKLERDKNISSVNENYDQLNQSVKAHLLIDAYRTRGHLLARLDPLDIEMPKTEAELDLDPKYYGFSDADYDQKLHIKNEVVGINDISLKNLINHLKHVYSANIGFEFMHIQSLEQRDWLQQKIENIPVNANFSKEEKKEILKDIIEFESFERFLHVKFPGSKRFSVEGAENALIAAEAVIKQASELGVKEVIIGMPHRGRLNVLTKIMSKPYASMLSEFQGNLAFPEDLNISGDVKYHLGTSSDRDMNGKKLHLSLTANPSHLEAVNPVVVGKVRAKQDLFNDGDRSQVMGILMHGDAAFAGQGVVAETLSLSDLQGYKTGGTVHIIVNNQIGFTTSPKNARLSRYPTEVAKIVQAPIFHVNGDDPEAVIKAARIATEFKHKFKKDVVLDIICYRLHGHNETDEPAFTQPLMYKKIANKETPATIYGKELLGQGVISNEELESIKQKFREFLDDQLSISQTYKPNKADWLEGEWKGFIKPTEAEYTSHTTGVDINLLKKIGNSLNKIPENIKIHPRIAKQLEVKQKIIEVGEGLDWAMGELLAYGTLLAENVPVRLSGQDCGRGTFSHRHAVLIDQENEERYIPLNNLEVEKQANYEVIDSNLSEFAVLGFEYGYSLVKPRSLVIWEAQFGDFSNGAQVIIDQFISSAEIKWLRMSGLVMLLPHAYEGQGPEHSSARLERYLQLCAEDNMQVANCTTPANFFHILRRQIHRNFRKPLVVMTPKSLLRHKLAVSSINEMAEGTKFKPVIGENEQISDDKVTKIIITSGKVYYDLLETRQKHNITNIALIRIEQYYPFPEKELLEELKKYKNANNIIWCQEEPKNMGAWDFIEPRIERVLTINKLKASRPNYVGRRNAASPANGYQRVHSKEQEDLIKEALSID